MRHVYIFDLDLVCQNLLFEDFNFTLLFDLFIGDDSIAFLYYVLDFALTTSTLYKRLPNSYASPATGILSIHDKASKEALELTLDAPSGEPSTGYSLCLDYRTDREWPSGWLDRPFFTFAWVIFGYWLHM